MMEMINIDDLKLQADLITLEVLMAEVGMDLKSLKQDTGAKNFKSRLVEIECKILKAKLKTLKNNNLNELNLYYSEMLSCIFRLARLNTIEDYEDIVLSLERCINEVLDFIFSEREISLKLKCTA